MGHLSFITPIRLSYMYLTPLFFFLAQVCPQISDEQEAFIHRVLEIPLEQRKWKDLITLDTLHAYCGGPPVDYTPSPIDVSLEPIIHSKPSIFLYRNGIRKTNSLGEEGRRHAQATGVGFGVDP